MNLPQKYWDELANRYPRYNDPSILADSKFIFENAKNFGINIQDKTILDIGCSTGTLALNIANFAKQIDALDSSLQMLEVFENDSNCLNFSNKINIHRSSWADFNITKKYDIAIASMTPAINTDDLKSKFISSANDKIYVGWGDYKYNNVLDKLFEILKIDNQKAFGQAGRFCKFLENLNIKYELIYFQSSWSDVHKKSDAISYCKNHLERFDVKIDDNFLDDFLDDFVQNGFVKMDTQAQKGLVLFKN